MEEITSPDVADQISIARWRELLGEEAVGLLDEEVDRIDVTAQDRIRTLILDAYAECERQVVEADSEVGR